MVRNKARSSSLTLLLVPLFCMAAQTSFAATWSGVLVDANCFRSAQENHNVSDSPAEQDVGFEIRLCTPKAKTHSFAIVAPNGQGIALDSAGNKDAMELVRQGVPKAPLRVTVNGQINKKTIEVSSITPVQPVR